MQTESFLQLSAAALDRCESIPPPIPNQNRESAHTLLECQAQIASLESQLRVAQNVRDLLEREVESLRASRKKDSELCQIEATARRFSEKCEKWKNRFESLRCEHKQLTLEFQSMRESHKSLKKALDNGEMARADCERDLQQAAGAEARLRKAEQAGRGLALDFQEISLKYEKAMKKLHVLRGDSKRQLLHTDNLQKKLEQLLAEKNSLETTLHEKNMVISQQQCQMDEMQQRLEKMKSATGKMSEMKAEDHKIRTVTKVLAKEVERLRSVATEFEATKSVLSHIGDEFLSICALVGSDLCPIEKPWSSLRRKCEELMSVVRCAHEIKVRNIGLERELKALRMQIQTRHSSGNMLGLVKDLQDTNANHMKRITQFRYVQALSARIVSLYFRFLREISGLHRALFGIQHGSLKVVIMAVLFSRRLTGSIERDPVYNTDNLTVFAAPLSIAPDVQLADIHRQFRVLTDNCVALKKAEVDLRGRLVELEYEKGIRDSEERLGNVGTQTNAYKVKVLTHRVVELQAELSGLISPQLYDEVCTTVSRLEGRLRDGETQIERLKRALKERDRTEQELKDEIQAEADKRAKEAMIGTLDRDALALERQTKRPSQFKDSAKPVNSHRPPTIAAVIPSGFLCPIG
jgi:chromosome segregation ATPase